MKKTGELVYIDNTKVGEQTVWFDPNPALAAKMAALENCRFDNEMMCWRTNFCNIKLQEFIRILQHESVVLASQLLITPK